MAQGAAIGGVVSQLAEHVVHQGIEVGEGAARYARLAVNAHAEFHLVVGQGEGGLASGRHGTGVHGNADGAALVVDAAG
ncbi:hypothetical protein D3C85_777040 [compost metagenome]